MHLYTCIWVVLLISRLNIAFLSLKLSHGIDKVLVCLCPYGFYNPRNTLRWKLLQWYPYTYGLFCLSYGPLTASRGLGRHTLVTSRKANPRFNLLCSPTHKNARTRTETGRDQIQRQNKGGKRESHDSKQSTACPLNQLKQAIASRLTRDRKTQILQNQKRNNTH
jgi:hypothetical protein